MKISKLFHKLYAFLMFLPVMVLPLFAININQKVVEPLTAQIEETKVITVNQLVPTFSSHTDSVSGVDFTWFTDGSIHLEGTSTGTIFADLVQDFTDVIKDHTYLVLLSPSVVGSSSTFSFAFATEQSFNVYTDWIFVSSFSTTGSFQDLTIRIWNDVSVDFYVYPKVIDLTLWFNGNIPQDLLNNPSSFSNYYDGSLSYNIGTKSLWYTGVFDTLDNTDVGSQFLYSLYNPLQDYFNLPNYMNLGGLYDWFLINLFSGYNSPVYFIIFDLMIYWLALSLLWLIFDVMMYVPSMIHKMLDKARME